MSKRVISKNDARWGKERVKVKWSRVEAKVLKGETRVNELVRRILIEDWLDRIARSTNKKRNHNSNRWFFKTKSPFRPENWSFRKPTQTFLKSTILFLIWNAKIGNKLLMSVKGKRTQLWKRNDRD